MSFVTLQISKSTFERLQELAIPLVDTPDSVINTLIDAFMISYGKNTKDFDFHAIDHKSQMNNADSKVNFIKKTSDSLVMGLNDDSPYDPDSPPNLFHTKLLNAKFNGIHVENWRQLVVEAHRQALAKYKSFERLSEITLSNCIKGSVDDVKGYHSTDFGISIQNADANISWRNALHLARCLNVPVDIRFVWFDKPEALYPGKTGKLRWYPEAS